MSSDLSQELEEDNGEETLADAAKCLASSPKVHDSVAKGAGAGVVAGAVDPKYGPVAAAGATALDMGAKAARYTFDERDGEYRVRDGIKDASWPVLGVAAALEAEESLGDEVYAAARGAYETAHEVEDQLEEVAEDIGLSLPDEQIYNGIIDVYQQSPELIQNAVDAAPESAGSAALMPALGIALGAAAFKAKEVGEKTSVYLEGNPVYEKAREVLDKSF